MIDYEFRRFLASNLNVPVAIGIGAESETRINFERARELKELAVDGSVLRTRTFFEVDIISSDLETCNGLADSFFDIVHSYQGVLITSLVDIIAENDGYEFVNSLADKQAKHVMQFSVEIIS